MDDNEKEMIIYNDGLMKKILKSGLYTIITVFYCTLTIIEEIKRIGKS